MQDTRNDQQPERNLHPEDSHHDDVENAGEGPEIILTEDPVEEGTPADAGKLAEMEDRFKRLMAEFENFRKRSAREKGQERQRGRREAIEKLLPVYDSLTLGLLSLKPNDPARSGMKAVHQQLLSSFEDLGLVKLATKGEKFDPERHEAIANLPNPEVPEGVIIEESRSGFEDEVGLLRPAQVVVSAGDGS
ncbi:MAG: nucleotide exchange factor GrpE [Candidatus Sumerlaeia bacterium]|nr:nucleotide exchange factor GrpE [Candidatus Sumerlaeia bacterium]